MWLILVSCGEVCRIVGAGEWLDEFWRVDKEKGWRAYVTE